MTTAVTDGELVSAWRNGDESAANALILKYQDLAVRSAYLLVRNHHDAEDVAQEAFVKALKTCDRLREGVSFATWLHRSLIWVAGTRHRRRRWREVFDRQSDVGASDSFENAAALRVDIARAIGDLPWRLRAVVTLRFLAGLTESETAYALSCPVGTIKSRTARALEALARSRHLARLDEQRMPSSLGG